MRIFKKLFGGSDSSKKIKIDLEKLLASDDTNRSIIELDNYIGELCTYGDDLHNLSEPQKQFYYNQWLEREINNGGFNQFFFNSSGDFAHQTVQSLLSIGANRTADILQKARTVFSLTHMKIFAPGILILFLILTSCKEQAQREKEPFQETSESPAAEATFKNTIDSIRNSDIYENPKNWEARGLNPSDQTVILRLRKATNDFLDKLEKIHTSDETSRKKRTLILGIIDELPWDQLDTEEREFMADTLAPAIKAAGFDPWSLF